MAMDKRVEILFDRRDFEELKAEARRRRMSLGELIRETMRRTYRRPSAARRRRALAFWTSGPEIDVGTWEEAKKLIGRWVDKDPYDLK